MEKNSFTLFETLLSVVILSIVMAGFYKLSIASNDQEIYAQFLNHKSKSTVESFGYTYDNSVITITNAQTYKKIVYQTKDIYLEKYTLQVK